MIGFPIDQVMTRDRQHAADAPRPDTYTNRATMYS